MKNTKPFIYLLAISIILTSCSKSNKDYVGEYKSQFTVDVKAENTQTFWASRGFVESPTGFNAVDLGSIYLNLVLNESTNTLTGNGGLNIPVVQPTGYSTSKQRVRRNFDVIAPNIKNDTLFFSIQPLSSNSRMNAYLIKDGDKVFLGLDKSMCSTKANGPQYIKSNGRYNQYNTNDPELMKNFNEFISGQMDHNDSLMVNPALSDKDKKMLQNANDYYSYMYVKK